MRSFRGASVGAILVFVIVATADNSLTQKDARANDQKFKRIVNARRSTTTTHRRTKAFQGLGQVSALDLCNALNGDPDSLVVSNAQYNGSDSASGLVDLTGSGHFLEASLERAVVLTTGDGSLTVDTVNDLKDSSTSLDVEGSDKISATSYDAAELQFVVTPKADGLISWQYVFASEEYPEYVGSRFNDAFRFLVDSMDVAILPGSNDKVSINNINKDSNAPYFIDNSDAKIAAEYDGLTILLTTQAVRVSAGTPYHIRLLIADVSDTDYDSAVYIKAGSLVLKPSS